MTRKPGTLTTGAVIRIVLADDHPVVREGLAILLRAQPDLDVVGEAADGEDACRLVRELAPDVAIVDLSMPVLGGIEAAERIGRDHPDVRIVALTVHEEPVYYEKLLRAGASGYVLKRAASDELVRAIRAVVAGGTYLDPTMTGHLVGRLLDRPERRTSSAPALSPREHDVLLRIAQGFSNKAIAELMGISVKTVETYKARIAEKLELRSRVDIVRYVATRGLLDTP